MHKYREKREQMTATKFSVVGLLAATGAQAAKFGGFAGMGDFKEFGPRLGNIGQDVNRKLSGFGGPSSGGFDASAFGFNGGTKGFGGFGGGAAKSGINAPSAPW